MAEPPDVGRMRQLTAPDGNAFPDQPSTQSRLSAALIVVLVQMAVSVMTLHAADRLPRTSRLESVRRIFHNGEHNAFTDMCQFQGRFYLTFRSCPDGHGVYPTSSIIVLASDDGKQWNQVHRFSVPKRDTRDPHLLVFRGQLFVYTGTLYYGDGPPEQRDMNQNLGYAVWTEDGKSWQGPRMLEGTYGHYVWRAATDGKKAYLCAYRVRSFADTSSQTDRKLFESALLESDDGLIWRWAGLFREQYASETAFLFEENGSLVAVSRGGDGRPARVCYSYPPYQKWNRKNLERNIGGPLIAKWGNRYLVGGRNSAGRDPKTVLSWLVDDRLHDFAELPSDGDNSYPGFIELSPTQALVSYYSTHESNENGQPITAIYLAEIRIVE